MSTERTPAPWPYRENPRHRSIDYSAGGAYFVTLCLQGMRCRLGRVVGDRVALSAAGRMVQAEWQDLERRYPFVALDAYIVMPNHLHGALILQTGYEAGAAPGKSLSGVIARFKTGTTYLYGEGVRTQGWPRYERRLWQRSFYERVIRNERELQAIREYIDLNPMRWAQDRLNPSPER